jgi:hypothetical protein
MKMILSINLINLYWLDNISFSLNKFTSIFVFIKGKKKLVLLSRFQKQKWNFEADKTYQLQVKLRGGVD